MSRTTSAQQIKRPVLRYHGGKWKLAPWIVSYFPKHRIYVEPFGGAASVLLRKQRSYAEIYNDLDDEVVTLFRVLQKQDTNQELKRLLKLTPFARLEFNEAYHHTNDPIERSRRLIIRSFMGFGSDGHNAALGRTGFRSNANRLGSTPAHDWANYYECLDAFLDRLQEVVIESRDATQVMAQHDSAETLHFVDPPYVLSTRSGEHYKFELTDGDHERLCDFLKSLVGMVVLCGYPNTIYDSLGWHTFQMQALADGARPRTEVLWLNPQAVAAQSQLEMFVND